jgi:galactokinase
MSNGKNPAPSTALAGLGKLVEERFAETYGRPPRWLAAAPGRVSIIGEDTDYNEGFVLPMAIDRYTVMAAAPSADPRRIEIRTTFGGEPVISDLEQALKPGKHGAWFNYPLGVIAGFIGKGLKVCGLDVLVHSTVPAGGGLSSSAALEVATATLLETVTGRALEPVEKALLCQEAEQHYAGVPCGIMDQFISVMGREGHLLLLDCRSYKTELIPVEDSSVTILIANTNVKHALSGGEYAQRRAQCEEAARLLKVKSLRDADSRMLEDAQPGMDEVVYRRARHVISENERTVHTAEGVRVSNWRTVGQLMYASHYSLKNDYEVSCRELDAVVESALSIGIREGVYGCRMTGGGFGGCAVALVETAKVSAICERLTLEYETSTGIKPSLFVSRPSAGAIVLKA